MPATKVPYTRKKLDNSSLKKHISDWATRQLAEIQKGPVPICLHLSNGDFLVGTRKVHKISDTCWSVNTLEFRDKRSAIFYCAFTHQSQYRDASNILKLDQQVSNLEADKTFFRYKLDKAHLAKDVFKIDLFGSRYDDFKKKLARSKEELEKLLSRAKYLNNVLGT